MVYIKIENPNLCRQEGLAFTFGFYIQARIELVYYQKQVATLNKCVDCPESGYKFCDRMNLTGPILSFLTASGYICRLTFRSLSDVSYTLTSVVRRKLLSMSKERCRFFVL